MPKTNKAPKSVTPRKPWVQAFRSGKHTDAHGVEREYSEGEIDRMAQAINAQVAGGFNPPIVLGHPRTDGPREGGVYGAVAVGSSPRHLYLYTDELVPEFAEAVEQGKYKYCSVALYPDLGLRHLGVLGGTNPAVKGLEPLAFFGEGMFSESDKGRTPEEVTLFQEEPMSWTNAVGSALLSISWRLQSVGRIFSALRDDAIARGGSVEDADKIYDTWAIQSLSGFDLGDLTSVLTDGAPSAFSEPAPGDDPRMAPLQEQIKQLQTALDAERSSAGARLFAERLDALAEQGRLTPPQRKALEDMHKKISASGTGTLQYAEGDPAFAELDALISSLPKQIEFSELPHGRPTPSSNPLIAESVARRESATR